MKKKTVKTTKTTRKKSEVMTDLIREERIEMDLIRMYSTLLESGLAACIDVDLIDVVYHSLETLKDESIRHQKMIHSIIIKNK